MTWNTDPAHTEIAFAVRHMGLSTVRGRFERFEGAVETDDANRPLHVRMSIETDSITTGASDRDKHLRSTDFFDAATHPTITFESSAVDDLGGGRYRVQGSLDMHGVTKPVVLEAEIAAPITDPFGQRRVAATVSGRINRKDWGLTWNSLLETGAFLVSEDVTLQFEVQATAQSRQDTVVAASA